jgi:hypothetical protein
MLVFMEGLTRSALVTSHNMPTLEIGRSIVTLAQLDLTTVGMEFVLT